MWQGDILRYRKIAYKKILYILVEIIEVLFMKIFFASKDMRFPYTNIWSEYFGFYMSGKNGSVFRMISDLKRNKIHQDRTAKFDVFIEILYET